MPSTSVCSLGFVRVGTAVYDVDRAQWRSKSGALFDIKFIKTDDDGLRKLEIDCHTTPRLLVSPCGSTLRSEHMRCEKKPGGRGKKFQSSKQHHVFLTREL